MKRLLVTASLMSICLPCVLLLVGCGDQAATTAKTPEKTKAFGVANQPMPPEAREAIMKASQQKGPPAAAAPSTKP